LSASRQRIVVLISGRGSNMRALAERSRSGGCFEIAAVISDQPAAGGLDLAREFRLDNEALPAPKGIARALYDQSLAQAINAHRPALVVLAGFMRILSAAFVQEFSGRMLNIHPSLLPKYPGLHTHQRVLEAREREHGATVHFVTEQLDGGPAVIQAKVPVETSDTEASLAARVQVQEHKIYPLAVNWFCEDRLRVQNGIAWLDGKSLSAPVPYPELPGVRA
jgi:phosphoribosylglycinamide formyltransferase-1